MLLYNHHVGTELCGQIVHDSSPEYEMENNINGLVQDWYPLKILAINYRPEGDSPYIIIMMLFLHTIWPMGFACLILFAKMGIHKP